MSVFKDFPGLENREKLFQDFQGPARALNVPLNSVHRTEQWCHILPTMSFYVAQKIKKNDEK